MVPSGSSSTCLMKAGLFRAGTPRDGYCAASACAQALAAASKAAWPAACCSAGLLPAAAASLTAAFSAALAWVASACLLYFVIGQRCGSDAIKPDRFFPFGQQLHGAHTIASDRH